MQGRQRGAIGSFPDTLGFEHGSTSSDMVNQWENNIQNSPSNGLPDYISLNSSNQEEDNVSMWTVGEPSSSSGPNQMSPNESDPRPDRGWSSLIKPFPDPPSSVLSLGDHSNNHHGSSSSFTDTFELDDHRVSRKRKAAELGVGQSSSGPDDENLARSDDIIPRLGLRVGGASNENPVVDSAHRNGLNSSSQQDPLPDDDDNNNNNNNNNNNDIYAPLRLNPVDFGSPPLGETRVENSSSSHESQSPTVLRIPALRRNLQSTSRWTRNSTSRSNRSSNLVISGDRNEIDSISDHPLFAQPRNSVQTDLNWSSNGGGTVNNSRRLSAFLRRSLLSATDGGGSGGGGGGQNGNIIPRIPPVLSTSASSSSSSSSQDIGNPPVHHHNHNHNQAHSRSSLLLGRQLEGAFGLPYLSRTMTGGSEGRGRLVSEIRNVLDLMRRGEPLRFEDLMILDQSVMYGIGGDIHDRHRDMRLDIDNMSYEELLALEERIGNVNTGLSEETISKHLKQTQYLVETGQPDVEPCCICQEEYNNGDDLGTLECGHDFHHVCIKQWLKHKNSCPICKSMGFAAT